MIEENFEGYTDEEVLEIYSTQITSDNPVLKRQAEKAYYEYTRRTIKEPEKIELKVIPEPEKPSRIIEPKTVEIKEMPLPEEIPHEWDEIIAKANIISEEKPSEVIQPVEKKRFGKRKPDQPKKIKVDKGMTVLNNLKEKKIIDDDQYKKLALIKKLTRERLFEELVRMKVISPTEPLDETFKDFKDELGSLNPGALVLFTNALRVDFKGLKEMTPIPAKAFPIPANVLFMIIIGMALFMVIVFPNIQSIEKGIGFGVSQAGGGGSPLGGIGNILNGIGGKH